MIGESVLLFPDSGDSFMRSLRTAVLYSGTVQVLTADEISISKANSAAGPDDKTQILVGDPEASRRLRLYSRFLQSAASDISLLRREGVLLTALSKQAHTVGNLVDCMEAVKRWFASWASEHSSSSGFLTIRSLDQFVRDCPPSLADIVVVVYERLIALTPTEPDDESDIRITGELLSYLVYLLTIIVIAERSGCGLSTWSPVFTEALWSCRSLLKDHYAIGKSLLPSRRSAAAQLGQYVLSQHLPRAEDLPFEEILELRRKRTAELESFRVAIEKLATTVDLEKSPREIELQVHDIAAAEVNPAVVELNAALRGLRLEALAKIGKSWKALASATTPVVLSLAAGAPLSLSAALGILGLTGSQFVDYAHEKKKLLSASQWSFIFHLQKLRK